ncbi:hypothetical protein [Streptomyces sp. NPDC046909]|uniref:hypothetical protein n=1 Tax=Streptomyces sp. NPDC046909 TaxID=3155617 RepID=UPI0033C97EDE
MTSIASTPAHPGDDFDQATRQALRLVSPARLRLITTSPRPAAQPVPSEGTDLEALAISIGVLHPVHQTTRPR